MNALFINIAMRKDSSRHTHHNQRNQVSNHSEPFPIKPLPLIGADVWQVFYNDEEQHSLDEHPHERSEGNWVSDTCQKCAEGLERKRGKSGEVFFSNFLWDKRTHTWWWYFTLARYLEHRYLCVTRATISHSRRFIDRFIRAVLLIFGLRQQNSNVSMDKTRNTISISKATSTARPKVPIIWKSV